MDVITIREVGDDDAEWIVRMIAGEWGTEFVVSGGRMYHPHTLPGYVAEFAGNAVGLITYLITGLECEIITLNSQHERGGVGSALVDAVVDAARSNGCTQLRLITTNDNINALRFYQKRGFRLVSVHRDAVTQARRIKPSIPFLGLHDIPLHDELELAMPIGTGGHGFPN
jgi:ribosomal protein S18 acetylase RimI-like enzyme